MERMCSSLISTPSRKWGLSFKRHFMWKLLSDSFNMAFLSGGQRRVTPHPTGFPSHLYWCPASAQEKASEVSAPSIHPTPLQAPNPSTHFPTCSVSSPRFVPHQMNFYASCKTQVQFPFICSAYATSRRQPPWALLRLHIPETSLHLTQEAQTQGL